MHQDKSDPGLYGYFVRTACYAARSGADNLSSERTLARSSCRKNLALLGEPRPLAEVVQRNRARNTQNGFHSVKSLPIEHMLVFIWGGIPPLCWSAIHAVENVPRQRGEALAGAAGNEFDHFHSLSSTGN
ncbi:hypothetical protein AVEN_249482-1 [Araneus ventricosus]|uniref:Uncharacterized protein n=1 Tax=Araneus ventricosus TaxID=182803 RepID=A0A4Y2NF49_ARAVE|nr:hypothetical protein AVEN_249482-1 [Araneus ventricosus]